MKKKVNASKLIDSNGFKRTAIVPPPVIVGIGASDSSLKLFFSHKNSSEISLNESF
jgi:hypothetical protein